MGFMKDSSNKTFENFDIKLIFYEKGSVILPIGINLKSSVYVLNSIEKKEIDFVLKNVPITFAEDEKVRIEIKNNCYELTINRDLASGSECYEVNKYTGEKSLKWHEHPLKKEYINNEKEDVFFEIK
jgi:hypothetical protein